jgi:hypothetical protein
MDGANRKTLWRMDPTGSALAPVAELHWEPGPLGEEHSWFGYYGHIPWRQMFDWHRGGA